MPPRILKSRAIASANLASLLIGAAAFSMWLFLSLYLQQIRGLSSLQAGIAFMPMTLALVSGAAIGTPLINRFGVRRVVAGGTLAQAAGLFFFTRLSVGAG